MKIVKSLIVILIMPVFTFSQGYVSADVKYKYDYKKCILTATKGKWIKNGANNILPVKVTLSNTADNAFECEYSETCWKTYYGVNNSLLEVEGSHETCTKNLLYALIILPHQSVTFDLNVVCLDTLRDFHGKFKIDFHMVLGNPKVEEVNFIDRYGDPSGNDHPLSKKEIKEYDKAMKNRNHIVWSNTIEA
jgi:hypothetical protein